VARDVNADLFAHQGQGCLGFAGFGPELFDLGAARLSCGLDHLVVGRRDAVDHPLLIAELLDVAVAVGDEPFNLGLPVRGGLLFDGLGEPLHGTSGAVVHLDQHLGHPLERLLHPLAGADRAFFPSLYGSIRLFDAASTLRGSISRTMDSWSMESLVVQALQQSTTIDCKEDDPVI